MAASARLLRAGAASASVCAAARAARPISRIAASRLPALDTALSGAFMALIRLALRFPTMSGAARRGGRPNPLSTLLHSHSRGGHGKVGTCEGTWYVTGVVTSWLFRRVPMRVLTSEGVPTSPTASRSASRSTSGLESRSASGVESRLESRLPDRLPVGATYVVEGFGGDEGNFRVTARYIRDAGRLPDQRPGRSFELRRRRACSPSGGGPAPKTTTRCQGISKAGNSFARRVMIEVAWLWRKYQPDSALAKWYEQRAAGQSPRIRRIMLVALARKLIVALWRYVEIGLVPAGAISCVRNDAA